MNNDVDFMNKAFAVQILIPMNMLQGTGGMANITATVTRSPKKSIKPKKTGSLALFFRKVNIMPSAVCWSTPQACVNANAWHLFICLVLTLSSLKTATAVQGIFPFIPENR